MQETITSQELALRCQQGGHYLLFDPIASNMINSDVVQVLKNEDVYPLFAGTRFAHVENVSPQIIRLDSIEEVLLSTLLKDRKCIIFHSLANREDFYKALSEQIEKTSDIYGLVMLRFWSACVMKALLHERLVNSYQWLCDGIYLPQYSGQVWIEYSLERNNQRKMPDYFTNVTQKLGKIMSDSRIAYWIGSLPQWQTKASWEIELTALSLSQLISSGITNQVELIEWADWLAEYTDIQSCTEWHSVLMSEAKHQDRLVTANQLKQKIKANK